MQENQICTDSSNNLVDVISVLENPFSGLETTWKQNKYCEKKGVFCTTYILDKFVSCSCKERTAAKSHKNVTGLCHKNWISNNLCVFWVY